MWYGFSDYGPGLLPDRSPCEVPEDWHLYISQERPGPLHVGGGQSYGLVISNVDVEILTLASCLHLIWVQVPHTVYWSLVLSDSILGLLSSCTIIYKLFFQGKYKEKKM
jgi:hypothetical protein